MADADRTGSRRKADADADAHASPSGVRESEAFALLGNETRLDILLAIWEHQVPLAEDNTVSFSRLFDRVDCDDRGTFSYHLERLDGPFIVQHTERGGYELSIPGLKLVQTIIAGTGVREASLEPTEIEQPCPLCDAPTTIAFRDGVVFLCCTDCDGMAPGAADVDGVLLGNYFEPAGLGDRTPEELHAASIAATMNRARSLFDGLCPSCSGPVEGRLECCPDHEPTGGCPDCGRRFGAWTHFQCRTCKHYAVPDPMWLAMYHPAVVAFYDDHGVSTRVHADDVERARRVYTRIYDQDLDLRSTEPPRVAVTASIGGDQICLTFDETARVVDVHR